MTIPNQDMIKMQTKACSKCNLDKPVTEFYSCATGRTGLQAECKTCTQARSKARVDANREEINAKGRIYSKWKNKVIKDAVFAAYGGYVCACCGETEKLFLTLDHINNDGAAFRRMINGSRTAAGHTTYRWLVKNGFPKGFQVLCMNCNHGKRMNQGICPHVRCNDQGINPIGASAPKRSTTDLRLVKVG